MSKLVTAGSAMLESSRIAGEALDIFVVRWDSGTHGFAIDKSEVFCSMYRLAQRVPKLEEFDILMEVETYKRCPGYEYGWSAVFLPRSERIIAPFDPWGDPDMERGGRPLCGKIVAQKAGGLVLRRAQFEVVLMKVLRRR